MPVAAEEAGWRATTFGAVLSGVLLRCPVRARAQWFETLVAGVFGVNDLFRRPEQLVEQGQDESDQAIHQRLKCTDQAHHHPQGLSDPGWANGFKIIQLF